MKYLIRNLGVLMIIAAVVLLGLYAFNNMVQNTYLIISLALIISGVIIHIIVNKIVEE